MARGDKVDRRYVTRFELLFFSRRVRADLHSSDWPARVGSWIRKLIPNRWRGTRRERELRDYLVDFIKRAAEHSPVDYERLAEGMQRLHNQAVENRLRGMALAELKMLIEAPLAPAPVEPHQPAIVASTRS
jgi:hypothetical protein